jgi:urease gamma subunit
MNLSPREKDKLLISLAAMVARNRLMRGVKLNHPEAIALITDFVVEGARDGRSVADLMEAGAHVVTCRPMHGGHRRDDPRRAGGGDLSRRHEARDRPSPDPVARTDVMIFTFLLGLAAGALTPFAEPVVRQAHGKRDAVEDIPSTGPRWTS